MENSRLKFHLDTTVGKFESEQLQLMEARSNEIKLRQETENQLRRLQENIAENDEKVRRIHIKTIS